jgi:hypothetical protein
MPSASVAELSSSLTLRATAAEYFGPVLLIPVAASLIIGAAAFVVMRLYMRAVFRESRRSALDPQAAYEEEIRRPQRLLETGPLEIQSERPGELARTEPARTPTFRYAAIAFRRGACVYTLAGLVFAATATVLVTTVGEAPTPFSASRLTLWGFYAGEFWAWCLIVAIGLALFWGPDRRFRVQLFAGYALLLVAAGALLQLAGAPGLPFTELLVIDKDTAAFVLSIASATTGQAVTPDSVTIRPWLQLVVFWSLSATPVGFVFVAFNRPVRGTVGPLFVTTALIMLVSAFIVVDVIIGSPFGRGLLGQLKRITGGAAALATIWAVALTVSAFVAWFGLKSIARRYRGKRSSDQMFLFDSLWLSASIYVCVALMNHTSGYLLGLLPFALYKLVVRYGLRPLATGQEPRRNARLLFLRVFGSPGRSEKLFDLLSARWRCAGSIQLISATDVARVRFEPDEFLDFLGGRLASGYIRSDVDLDRRLADLDLRTDPDGRYRINEFFCHVDTWQRTVKRLMAQSDVVAMDLRAFTASRAGVIFELGALIDILPISRVALLVDQTTDEPLLRRILSDRWLNMSPDSPNALTRSATARIIDLAGGYPAAVGRLLRLGDDVLASDVGDAAA